MVSRGAQTVAGSFSPHLGHQWYMFTYPLDQDERVSRRLTLWRRGGQGWTMLHPQGTLVA
jgi:hypothetical protein